MRRTLLAIAVCLVAACANGQEAAAPPKEAPVSDSLSSRAELVAAAAARVLSAAPAAGEWPVLLSIGPGEAAEAAAADLRAALGRDPRIRFTKSRREPAPPVPDASVPGGHVHAVVWVFDPPPRLVVRVFEMGDRLHIAARDPGGDPLGPPSEGWLWKLSGP